MESLLVSPEESERERKGAGEMEGQATLDQVEVHSVFC